VKVDGAVPIGVEKRPKPRVHRLLAAFIHRSFTVVVDGFLLGLLGAPDVIVIIALLRIMPLIHLMLIMHLVARMRGVIGGRRIAARKCNTLIFTRK
jgi:hypothetical protein